MIFNRILYCVVCIFIILFSEIYVIRLLIEDRMLSVRDDVYHIIRILFW